MKNKNLTTSALVFAALLALVAVLLFFVYYLFGESEKVAVLRLDVEDKSGILSDSRALNRDLAEMVSKKKIIDGAFIKKGDLVVLVEGVEELAKTASTSLEWKAINASGASENNNLSLVADGTFGQVYQFMALLENFKYPLNIVRASMGKIDAKNGWSLNLEINAPTFGKTF